MHKVYTENMCIMPMGIHSILVYNVIAVKETQTAQETGTTFSKQAGSIFFYVMIAVPYLSFVHGKNIIGNTLKS